MSNKFEIFISYRRKGGYDTAKLIYDRLRLDGYSVFFDIDTLEKGSFDKELNKRVSDCKDFLLVLSPGVFDRFLEEGYNDKDDWMRTEIARALETDRNIVPLVLDGFVYPKNLPPDIDKVTRKNAIDLNPKHFEAAYARMKQRFLDSKPHFLTRHKKKIISFISIMFLALAACLFFAVSAIYQEKDLEAREAKIEAQKADSIRIIKEIEMAHTADSIKRFIDSLQKITAKPVAVKVKKTEKAEKQKPAENNTLPSNNTATSPNSKLTTLHWGGSSDNIGQVIFGKIAAAGVKKTKCSGNGVIVKNNDASCKATEGKFTCSYSPKIIFSDCKGKAFFKIDTDEVFETVSQISEAAAREELANDLRKTNFNDWVATIKEDFKTSP